jgi:MFS family permease
MSETKTEAYQAPPNGFRTFIIVWITQSISAFGSQLTFFALTIWLAQVLYPTKEQKQELAFALAAISLAFTAAVFFAPIAGAWADRHDRKRTMMVVDVISGFLSVILLVLMLNNALQLWMLIIVVAAFALVGLFHYSAFDSSYAMIVPEKQLARANGMMQTMWALSGILAPAVAAAVISYPGLVRQGTLPGGPVIAGFRDGTPILIAVDVVTFFVAAATLLFLNIPSPKRADMGGEAGKPKPSLWADIKEGALYIWNRKPLLWLLATFTVINFASTPIEIFIPLMLKFNLANSWQSMGMTFEQALALLSSAAAVGGLVGGLAISAWGGLKRKRVYGVVVPILIVGVLMIFYGLSQNLYLTVALNFLIVGLTPVMNAHSQSIWQSQTPRQLQGRVFSVRRVIAQFSAPLGVVIAGVAGGLLDPGMVLVVLGAFVALFCTGQLFNRYLLHVEDKAFLDNLAGTAPGAEPEAPGDSVEPALPPTGFEVGVAPSEKTLAGDEEPVRVSS